MLHDATLHDLMSQDSMIQNPIEQFLILYDPMIFWCYIVQC